MNFAGKLNDTGRWMFGRVIPLSRFHREIRVSARNLDWPNLRLHLDNLFAEEIARSNAKRQRALQCRELSQALFEATEAQYFGKFEDYLKRRDSLLEHLSDCRLAPLIFGLGIRSKAKRELGLLSSGREFGTKRGRLISQLPRAVQSKVQSRSVSFQRAIAGKRFLMVGPDVATSEISLDHVDGVAAPYQVIRTLWKSGLLATWSGPTVAYVSSGAAGKIGDDNAGDTYDSFFLRLRHRKSLPVAAKRFPGAKRGVIGLAAEPTKKMVNFYGPFSGIGAIVDLLLNGASSVHVVGMNFYLSPSVYSEEYGSYFPENFESSNVERSLRVHDPISNFRLLRRLFHLGRVSADDFLTGLLSGSELEFVRLLDNRFPLSSGSSPGSRKKP